MEGDNITFRTNTQEKISYILTDSVEKLSPKSDKEKDRPTKPLPGKRNNNTTNGKEHIRANVVARLIIVQEKSESWEKFIFSVQCFENAINHETAKRYLMMYENTIIHIIKNYYYY